MARKDRHPYTYHCTEKTPYRGHGLKDGVTILHSAANQAFSNARRTCKWCHADLGINFERSWEREERMQQARETAKDTQKASAELIRRISLSIDDRNGEKSKSKAAPAPAVTPEGDAG